MLSLAAIATALSSVCLVSAQANNPQCGVPGAHKCGSSNSLLVCDHGYWTKLSDCPDGTVCQDGGCLSSMSLDPNIYPNASPAPSPSTNTEDENGSSAKTSTDKDTKSKNSSSSKSSSDKNTELDTLESDDDESSESESSTDAAFSVTPFGLASSCLIAFAAVSAAVPAFGFF
ncbi:hypothetical protein LPJ75_001685 [Coemansia sp. RSA 2598]|nr:hypothetical protein LPJ75_001685 [Coemansia sp. RSA 2598]